MINLVTPMMRTQNLPRILVEIEKVMPVGSWTWWIVQDMLHTDPLTHPLEHPCIHWLQAHPEPNRYPAGFILNVALREILEGWIYAMADDTIPHENLPVHIKWAEESVAFNVKLIRWPVLRKGGGVSNDEECASGADAAGFAYRAECFPGFLWENWEPNNDAMAYGKLCTMCEKNERVYLKTPGGYYNYLR